MRERRKNFRVEWNSTAKIYHLDARFYRPCIVSNFSNGGAKIIGIEPSVVPDEFLLHIAPRIRPQRCKVIRRTKHGLAAIFTDYVKNNGKLKVVRPRRFYDKQSKRHKQWA